LHHFSSIVVATETYRTLDMYNLCQHHADYNQPGTRLKNDQWSRAMRKLDHDLRRREIAEVAARIIAAEGIAALTTRRLAREMRSSIGVLSHYFDSKAAIVMAAFSWASARIDQRLGHSLARGASIGKLLPLIEAALPHDEQSRMEWRVRLNLWSYAISDADAAALLRSDMERNRNVLVALLQQLQQTGEVRDDIDTSDVAQALTDLLHGMGFAALLGLQHPAYDHVGAFDTLIDDLRAPTTKPRRGAA